MCVCGLVDFGPPNESTVCHHWYYNILVNPHGCLRCLVLDHSYDAAPLFTRYVRSSAKLNLVLSRLGTLPFLEKYHLRFIWNFRIYYDNIDSGLHSLVNHFIRKWQDDKVNI